jgi:hypothetical protein
LTGKGAIDPAAENTPRKRGKKGAKPGTNTLLTRICLTNCLPARGDDHFSDPDQSDDLEESLTLDCVLPIQGINYPVKVPVTISWGYFQSIIAKELNARIGEITLSYRFSSFAAAENSEALCTPGHFQNMIAKAKDFLTGKQKVQGGKYFCVHLEPVFKQPLPTAAEVGPPKKAAGKASDAFLHPCL